MTHLAIASDFARALTEEQFAEYSRQGRTGRAAVARAQAAGSGHGAQPTSGSEQQAPAGRAASTSVRGVLSRLVHVRG